MFFAKGKLKTKCQFVSRLTKSNPNSFSVQTRPRTDANPIWGHLEPSPLEIIYYCFAMQNPIFGLFEPPHPLDFVFLQKRCKLYSGGFNRLGLRLLGT